MTFMMEPPKFIPVPVDDNHVDSSLRYPNVNVRGPSHRSDQYKLFMYSEFGFPQASNVRLDLKDSMPVLFVPGNAGSYQQVRSLASTCIRRQLQSLDAFKFIFYTIDFRGQLSGLNGNLIEEQTLFVHQALNQIAKLHNSETNGIILIGHSVGGFISKVLFTRPDFEPSSVPLVISLASPLTRPYLIFDDKMRALYTQTNTYWRENSSRRNSTVAISLSGGTLDRLVPSHLSLDPQFDLSLTTSAVKDVWLATDHVCITWCRELMHKLAHVLSAVMDKKQTRLKGDKSLVKSIILDELLLTENKFNQNFERKSTLKEWKSMRSYVLTDLRSHYSASNFEIGQQVIVLNATNTVDRELLIIVEHLGVLKENAIFSCQSISPGSHTKPLICDQKTDLMHLSHPVPTRRTEPKKAAFKIRTSELTSSNYIVFDFVSYAQSGNRVPESLFVQEIDPLDEQALYIPTLLEYLLNKLFFINSYEKNAITNKNLALYYSRYRLDNLKHRSQIFRIKLESHTCSGNEHPRGATINLYQGGYLTEAFHSETSFENKLHVVAKIYPKQATTTFEGASSYLELFMDGTCENKLKIEFYWMDLIVDIIQKKLGKVLACATYLAYLSIVSNAYKLNEHRQTKEDSIRFKAFKHITKILGHLLIYLGSDLARPVTEESCVYDELSDEMIYYVLAFTLSHGVTAYLGYFIKRLIDLATIINNSQSWVVHRFIRKKTIKNKSNSSENGAVNGAQLKVQSLRAQKRISADLDWILIGFTLAGSFLISGALNSLLSILNVIKLALSLEIVRSKTEEDCSDNKHCINSEKEHIKRQYAYVHDVLLSVAVICSLGLISNIPAALTRFNSNQITTFDFNQLEINFVASIIALIQIKFTAEKIDSRYIYRQLEVQEKQNKSGSMLANFPSKFLHPLTLALILLIDSNLCRTNIALAISLCWLNIYLVKLPIELQSKSKVKVEFD